MNSILSMQRTSLGNKLMGNPDYFGHFHPHFTKLLRYCDVVIATREGSPDQILGYVIATKVGTASVLVYIYVKGVFRHMGIAKRLMAVSGIDTNKGFYYYLFSPDAGHALRRKYPQAVYHPYILDDLLKDVA